MKVFLKDMTNSLWQTANQDINRNLQEDMHTRKPANTVTIKLSDQFALSKFLFDPPHPQICSFPESWHILGQLLNMLKPKCFFSVKEMSDGNLIPLSARRIHV